MKRKSNKGTASKSKKKKLIFLSVGLAATGVLSWFGWQYYKAKSQETNPPDSYTVPDFEPRTTGSESSSTTTSNANPKPSGSGFPLKKGSKGEKVKALQQALIAAHGSAILPKYGADGDFGSETVTALKKLNLPQVIDETTFNVLVKAATIEPYAVAKKLYESASKKNFLDTINALRTLKTPSDYSAVSAEFVKYKLGGVHQTLVNGLLGSFKDEKQKQEIRMAFAAMGLKYDGDKWSLSGLGDRLIVTTRSTKVWVNPSTYVIVPSRMVLGKRIDTRANFTLFENERQYFLVESNNINYYN